MEYKRCFMNKELSDWNELIRYAAFIHNMAPHISTNFTPFELMFGRLANLTGCLHKEPSSAFHACHISVQQLKVGCRAVVLRQDTN
jgi:hypothetical protein